MKHECVFAYSAMVTICCVSATSFAATVDFETVPLAAYGAAFDDVPGDVVLIQGGVEISVEEFLLGSFVGFIKAEVGGVYADQFLTTPLGLDNISVKFDFADVGFDVTVLTLEYQEFGGGNNFAVNGHALYQLGALTDLPADVAPGITASVVEQVSITLEAADGYVIGSFLIGGQELGIDNIVALPEPATAALLALGGILLLRRRRRRMN
ncbi:MAG: PEP-CTERM sorting domain-containing protein [Phycisphaerae bacterium]